MSTIKYIFLLISLLFIICQEKNNTEKPHIEKEIKEPQNENNNESFIDPDKETYKKNETLSGRHQKRNDFQSKIPYNMTMDEMDTMMFCTLVVRETVRTKKEEFEALQKKFNLSSVNPIYEKLGTDIFEKCNNKADIKVVHKYMKNLTYFNNFKWMKEFKELSDLDMDNYNNETDLAYTMNQQILMYKYQKVDELFRQKTADEKNSNEETENRKLKIGEIDMDSIPTSFKLIIFLIILILFFGGVFYLLKTLEKKPKDKKKKEKKKKTQ